MEAGEWPSSSLTRWRSSEENKAFWKYTPSGELKIASANGAIADEMAKRIGEEFYLDITPASEAASAAV